MPAARWTLATVTQELSDMKAVAAGGLESAMYSLAGSQYPGYVAATQSWGTPLWTQRLGELFTEGAAAGLEVDATYTPAYSAHTPTSAGEIAAPSIIGTL